MSFFMLPVETCVCKSHTWDIISDACPPDWSERGHLCKHHKVDDADAVVVASCPVFG